MHSGSAAGHSGAEASSTSKDGGLAGGAGKSVGGNEPLQNSQANNNTSKKWCRRQSLLDLLWATERMIAYWKARFEFRKTRKRKPLVKISIQSSINLEWKQKIVCQSSGRQQGHMFEVQLCLPLNGSSTSLLSITFVCVCVCILRFQHPSPYLLIQLTLNIFSFFPLFLSLPKQPPKTNQPTRLPSLALC